MMSDLYRKNAAIIVCNPQGKVLSCQRVENYDFFRPINTPILLCKESVKNDLINKQYTNLIFLEVGEII